MTTPGRAAPPLLCPRCSGTILAPTMGGVPRGSCHCPANVQRGEGLSSPLRLAQAIVAVLRPTMMDGDRRRPRLPVLSVDAPEVVVWPPFAGAGSGYEEITFKVRTAGRHYLVTVEQVPPPEEVDDAPRQG